MERSLPAPKLRVLILGGTSEATALGAMLAARADIDATMSLAGRTAIPILHPLPTRVGGFGGVDGLVSYLRDEKIDVLIDATHPFAARISENARAATREVGCKLIALTRPAWTPQPGDRWTEVADMAEAAAALGSAPRRVFLTIGALQLSAFTGASQHFYLVRTINPIEAGHGFTGAQFIEARGPFQIDNETRLMREHRIEVLVTKNSGGAAAVAKLGAARALGLPVILVRRPEGEIGEQGVAATLAEIEAHGAARRGV